LEIFFGTVCTQLMVNFGEEVIEFRLCCGRVSAKEISGHF